MERTELKLYTWINVAKNIAALSTCKYTQVGCVLLTKDFKVISSGFNGVISKQKHCCDVEHESRDAHGIFADKFEIHAEMNALLQVTEPRRLEDSICFSSLQPCYNCLKHLVQAGVRQFYFNERYWRVDTDNYIKEASEAFSFITIAKIDVWIDYQTGEKKIDIDKWL